MANVVETATSAVKAPIGFAKARPLAFVLLVIVLFAVAFRYRETIVRHTVKWPVVGGVFAWIWGTKAPATP